MRISVCAVIAVLLASNALARPVPPPKLLTPSGKWAIEYAMDMCALNRKFGSGADEMLLAIKPAPNSDQARIMVLLGAGFCVLAGILYHLVPADQMQMINFMKNLGIAGGLLMVFVHGAGRFAIDKK